MFMRQLNIAVGFLLPVLMITLAYHWVYELQPANPIVPFTICTLAGALFVYSWNLLGDSITE